MNYSPRNRIRVERNGRYRVIFGKRIFDRRLLVCTNDCCRIRSGKRGGSRRNVVVIRIATINCGKIIICTYPC